MARIPFSSTSFFVSPPSRCPRPAPPCSDCRPEKCVAFCFLACAVTYAASTACGSPLLTLFSIFFPFSSFRNQLGFLEKVSPERPNSRVFLVTIILLYKYLYWKLLVSLIRIEERFIYSCVFHLLRLNENSVNEIFETKLKDLLVIPWFHLTIF